MRKYAEVDENNVVTNVAVFDDDNTPVELGWSGWYETAEDLRKNWAGPGSIFVPEAEGYPLGLFLGRHPTGWVLDENYDWQPPADKPYPEGFGEEGSQWFWNNDTEDWEESVYKPSPDEDEDEEEE